MAAWIAMIPTAACGDSTSERLDVADEVGEAESSESMGDSLGDSNSESASNGFEEGNSEGLDGTTSAPTTAGDGDGDTMTSNGDTTTTTDGDGDGDGGTTMGDTTTGDGGTTMGDTTMGDGGTTSDGGGELCGDGIVGVGESCDDGNDVDDDACSNTCAFNLHDQCDAPYQVLDLASRNVQFNDGDGNVEWCDRLTAPNPDPQWAGAKWYRFTGLAGTRMPDSPPIVQSCGTEAPGWLLGGHPQILDGVVPGTACFSWSNDSCQWSTDIEIVNCGDFYLYHLDNTTTCSSRYCATN